MDKSGNPYEGLIYCFVFWKNISGNILLKNVFGNRIFQCGYCNYKLHTTLRDKISTITTSNIISNNNNMFASIISIFYSLPPYIYSVIRWLSNILCVRKPVCISNYNNNINITNNRSKLKMKYKLQRSLSVFSCLPSKLNSNLGLRCSGAAP